MTTLGQTCLELAHAATGIAILNRVIDALGDTPALLVSLGQLYVKTGDTIKGHALLTKALDLKEPKSA